MADVNSILILWCTNIIYKSSYYSSIIMDLLVYLPKQRWKCCLLAFYMASIKSLWLQMNSYCFVAHCTFCYTLYITHQLLSSTLWFIWLFCWLELSKWYLQFGIQQVKSSATVSFQSTSDHHHHRHISTPDKDAVNVHSLTAVTELFNEVMEVYSSLLLEVSYRGYIVEKLAGKIREVMHDL